MNLRWILMFAMLLSTTGASQDTTVTLSRLYEMYVAKEVTSKEMGELSAGPLNIDADRFLEVTSKSDFDTLEGFFGDVMRIGHPEAWMLYEQALARCVERNRHSMDERQNDHAKRKFERIRSTLGTPTGIKINDWVTALAKYLLPVRMKARELPAPLSSTPYVDSFKFVTDAFVADVPASRWMEMSEQEKSNALEEGLKKLGLNAADWRKSSEGFRVDFCVDKAGLLPKESQPEKKDKW
jgi:hypothetical protein